MGFDEHIARVARAEFPALARRIESRPLVWFDGPGGTQIPRPVLAAIADVYTRCNVNLGGAFETSREAQAAIDAARAAAADFLGAPSPATIAFGPNMTSLNFALARGLGRAFARGDEVLITALDHEANRGPWLGLRERGIVVREARATADGRLDLEHLASLVGERTRLIAVGIASNAFGSVTDFASVRALARRAGALTVIDAVHYAPHFPLDVVALDCDFLLCSAYKFYGPHVGLLYARSPLLERFEFDRLSVQSDSGPLRIETGTPNVAALAGVHAAIDYLAGFGSGGGRRAALCAAMHGIARYEHALAEAYAGALADFPELTLRGPPLALAPRAPTVSCTSARRDVGEIARELGARGIQMWHGHFYARRALESLGLNARGGLLRVGFSLYNTPEEVERVVDALRTVLF